MSDDDSPAALEIAVIGSEPIKSKSKKNKKKNKKQNVAKNSSMNSSLTAAGITLGTNWGVEACISPRGRILKAVRVLTKGSLVFAERAVSVVAHKGGSLCCICGKIASEGELLTSKKNETQSHWDTYCSLQCKESSIAGRYQELESLLYGNNSIDALVSKHSCDGDLINMVSKLACYKYLYQSENETNLMIDHGSYIATTYKGMDNLVSHLDKQPSEWISSVTAAMTELFNEYMDPTVRNVVTISLLVEIAAKVNANSYGIVNPQDEGTSKTVGFGLFPAVGLVINHSCYPNLYFTYNSTQGLMEYRTLVDVACGVELTVSYINSFQTLEQRQDLLVSSRYFQCECPRCSVNNQLQAYMSQHGYRHLTSSIQDTFTDVAVDGIASLDTTNSLNAIVSTIWNNNLPLSLVFGDLTLDGIHCKRCDDSKGVVILNHLNSTFGCVVCGYTSATTSEYTELKGSLDIAKSRWKNCNNIDELTRFLDDYDPLASGVGASTSAVLKARRTVKLHANNLCIIETNQVLADYYLSKGMHSKALPHYNRYLGSVKDILPANHPEVSSVMCQIIKCLTEVSKKGGGGNNSKERNMLYKQVVESRTIALGCEHLLTTQIARLSL